MTPSLPASASGEISAPSPAPPSGDSGVRAYCAPAHGQSLGVGGDGSLPVVVERDVGFGRVRYRLVRQPGDRLPAWDYLGNWLDVSVQHDLDLER